MPRIAIDSTRLSFRVIRRAGSILPEVEDEKEPSNMTLLPLVLPHEAAAYLRIDRRTLYNWNKTGRMNPIKLPGRGLRYRRDDILKLLGGEVKAA